MGPFENPSWSVDTGTGGKAAIMLAGQSGFVFDSYDADGDGEVTQSEMGLLYFNNHEDYPTTGQTQGVSGGCLRPEGSGVDVCLVASGMGLFTSLTTVAHELIHQFTSEHIYGSECLSKNYSIMSCTPGGGGRTGGDKRVVGLDPWFTARLGWQKPRVAEFESRKVTGEEGLLGGCDSLSSSNVDGGQSPIILYDTSRGSNEYFMLEYRNPSLGGYDSNAPSQGLGVWYVKTNADKSLAIFTPGISGSDSDAADFLLFPPDGKPGSGNLWTNRNGVFTVNWAGKDQPSNLFLGVGKVRGDSREMAVEWGSGGQFVPRFAEDDTVIDVTPGEYIRLQGSFGASKFGRKARLLSEDGTVNEEVGTNSNSWSCNEIGVTIPTSVPPGDYLLRVYNSDEALYVNSRRLRVGKQEANVNIVLPIDGATFLDTDTIHLKAESWVEGSGHNNWPNVIWEVDGRIVQYSHVDYIYAQFYSYGEHIVRFYALVNSEQVDDQVTIFIEESPPPEKETNTPPQATILEPSHNALIFANQSDTGGWFKSVALRGRAEDAQDGVLNWRTNTKWVVKNSAGVTVATDYSPYGSAKLYAESCTGSVYSISFTATDSGGLQGVMTIDIKIAIFC